jgi:3-oxoacyl-[acyl-carrier-protein] synthase II
MADSVVITGLGCLCGLGLDAASCWGALVEGRNPVKRFSLFDAGELSCNFGVELPPAAEGLFSSIKPRSRSQMTRATMISAVTADLAVADAALANGQVDPARIGVVTGATGTGYFWNKPGRDEHRILRNMANASSSWISLRNKYRGPSYTVSTACSSGAYALAGAFDLLLSGQCDAVVAGSADSSLNYADVEGFQSIMALSEEKDDILHACRPFDAKRSGFVMGEGGGMLVLEREDDAKKRGAKLYARLYRPGLSSEAYNMLSPQPGGNGMALAMQRALSNAQLSPSDIDYINAHGTSTGYNDVYETQAIKAVFGAIAPSVPVSSTKPQTGHCLAGAAGVEAVLCVMALCENTVPATLNLSTPDPQCDLDYVPGTCRHRQLDAVMSNSFAFGGHNGVCVFAKL